MIWHSTAKSISGGGEKRTLVIESTLPRVSLAVLLDFDRLRIERKIGVTRIHFFEDAPPYRWQIDSRLQRRSMIKTFPLHLTLGSGSRSSSLFR